MLELLTLRFSQLDLKVNTAWSGGAYIKLSLLFSGLGLIPLWGIWAT